MALWILLNYSVFDNAVWIKHINRGPNSADNLLLAAVHISQKKNNNNKLFATNI